MNPPAKPDDNNIPPQKPEDVQGNNEEIEEKTNVEEEQNIVENDENASDTKGLSDEATDIYYVVLYGVFAMPTETFEKIEKDLINKNKGK